MSWLHDVPTVIMNMVILWGVSDPADRTSFFCRSPSYASFLPLPVLRHLYQDGSAHLQPSGEICTTQCLSSHLQPVARSRASTVCPVCFSKVQDSATAFQVERDKMKIQDLSNSSYCWSLIFNGSVFSLGLSNGTGKAEVSVD